MLASPSAFRVTCSIDAATSLIDDATASVDDDTDSAVFRRLIEASRHDPKALAAVLRRPQQPITAESLARITCPTLLVIGDNDFAGPLTKTSAALPDASVVTLRRTDHFATPSSMTAMGEVLDFLDR